jgi:SSS family solute:Na+ symporter
MLTLDYLVIGAYFVVTFAVGALALRRKHETKEDYFLSGRKLPWHLAGLSMVATTFAADTPLAVTGITLGQGIAGNFLWLSLIPSGLLTAVVYARLWRRSNAMTDAEFATLRYSGKSAIFLRKFRALYLALPVNLIIMGWVTTGMAKVLGVFLDYPPWVMLAALYAVTVLYIVFSGLWGVVVTDVLQFFIAMVGCIVLAFISVGEAGGLANMWAKAATQLPAGHTAIYPWYFTGPVYVVVVWLGVQWWASWYPGFEPGGGGYVVQRLLSTKNENHAVGASILFNILHFVVRPWPWIITAIAAAVALPQAADHELMFPRAIAAWLPAGLKGLMVAAFLAAFMSTIATHLNWGAAYLVSDLLPGSRFEPRSRRGEIIASRLAIVVLAIGAIVVSRMMQSVRQGWELILMLSAGTGPVYLIRWYWPRMRAASEISAMCASLVFSVALIGVDLAQELKLCVVAVGTSFVWVAFTLFMRAPEKETWQKFSEKVRPGKWGWQDIAAFVSSVLLTYSAFFALGELLRQNYAAAAVNALVSATGCFALVWLLKRRQVSSA